MSKSPIKKKAIKKAETVTPLVSAEKPLVNKQRTSRLAPRQSKSGRPKGKKVMGRPLGRKVTVTGARVNLARGGVRIYTDEVVDNYSLNFREWLSASPDNIFICDWCEHAKIGYCTYDDWISRGHVEFTKVYNDWKRKQGHKVYQGALSKKFDSGFSKFALCCNHGYKDPSTHVQVTGAENTPLSVIIGLADGDSKTIK